MIVNKLILIMVIIVNKVNILTIDVKNDIYINAFQMDLKMALTEI